MYEIILSRHAAKAMNQMPPKARGRISRMLEVLREKPLQGKRLHGELEGLLSLRYGQWRIVYEIDLEKQLIIIHGIGPRGDIYK